MRLVALALVLAGCGPSCALVDARAIWAARGVVAPADVPVEWSWTWHVPCGDDMKAVGCYYDTRRIVVAERQDQCTEVLAHELGHAMGAAHLPPGQTGIMVHDMSDAHWRPYVTDDDLGALP